MSQHAKLALTLLRIIVGWLFLYAGMTKLLDPEWSAAGYLKSAQTFPWLYHWLASASNLAWVNFLNVWGQLLIGMALITGTMTVAASYSAIVMMLLFYFPVLKFPAVGHGLLVDEHIIYAAALWVLATMKAGEYYGGDGLLVALSTPRDGKQPSTPPLGPLIKPLLISIAVALAVIVWAITLNYQAQAKKSSAEAKKTEAALVATTYSAEQVAAHKTPADCWIIVNNKVYDATTYIPKHPVPNQIEPYCGKDGTVAFSTKNKNSSHTDGAQQALTKLYKGDLK